MTLALDIDRDRLAAFCRTHGIVRLAFFGSVLRPDAFRPDSDVDVIVEFAPDRVPGLMTFVRIQYELQDLLGRTVDLTTPDGLSPFIREDVLAQAQTAYAA
ncbi:DNA polymerase III subunit beta [Leptolyngbya valderiana BDU 20041]|nr:DNA polymerase III subunit beta [Leptolyngbya valderiana BDU 20041]